jgi:transposase-like protein
LQSVYAVVFLDAIPFKVKQDIIVKSWRNNWDALATFFKYLAEIRKVIYTTNIIDSYHRQLRKVAKGKSIFPTDDSLLKMLYLTTMDVTRKRPNAYKTGDKCSSSYPSSSRIASVIFSNDFSFISPLGEAF